MDTATPEIYTYGHTLSLHDALPIYGNEPEADGDGEEAPDQPAGLSGVDGEQRAHEGAGRFRFRDRPDAAQRAVVRVDEDDAAPIGAADFARRTDQNAISRILSLRPGDIGQAAAGNGGEGCAGGSRETDWRAGGRIGGQGNILRPDQRSDALFEFQHGAGRGDREGRQHRPQTHRPVPGIEPRGGGTLAYGKERGPPGPAPRPGGDQAQEKVGAEEEATDRDDPTAPRAEQVVVEADEKAHDAGLVPERHIDDRAIAREDRKSTRLNSSH